MQTSDAQQTDEANPPLKFYSKDTVRFLQGLRTTIAMMTCDPSRDASERLEACAFLVVIDRLPATTNASVEFSLTWNSSSDSSHPDLAGTAEAGGTYGSITLWLDDSRCIALIESYGTDWLGTRETLFRIDVPGGVAVDEEPACPAELNIIAAWDDHKKHCGRCWLALMETYRYSAGAEMSVSAGIEIALNWTPTPELPEVE